MLLQRAILEEIREGRVSLVFRRWRRPTVKAGGSLNTAIGVLAIDKVDVVTATQVTEADAKQAGLASRTALLRALEGHPEESIYRIAVRFAGADPRAALRGQRLTKEDWNDLEAKLRRMDGGAKSGAWIRATLETIAFRPATRAETLAGELGLARDAFKGRVRQLKALGLTESLEVGYRLSRRGKDVLKRLRE